MKFFGSILLLLPLFLHSQGRIDEWKAHFSFTPVISLTETSGSMVGATTNGIFFVDKKSFQITTKTKVEGLTEVGISAIAFASGPNLLLVGYENGNLDLLQDDRATNFPDLTRKPDLSNKTINRIICEGNFAYLCCAFGIVKIDLQKIEVSETWYFGPNNDLKNVYDLTTFNNSWWVATNRGIFQADKQNINLLDYRNWKLQTSLPQSDASFSSFALSDGLLFIHDKSNDRILSGNGVTWQIQFPEIKNIRAIKSASSSLMVLTNNEIRLVSKAGTTLINSYYHGSSTPEIAPRDALINSNSELWISDFRFGLTRRTGTSAFSHFIPDSPGSDQISALKAGPEDIFLATVTTKSSGIPEAAYSIWQAGIWQNFTAADDAGLKSIDPITSFAINKDHSDEYWASTAGSGLLYFQKNRVTAHYNELNSTLGAQGKSCIVTGLALDGQNNLWYANPTGKVSLGTRSASGTFIPLPYPGISNSNSMVGDIISTSTSTQWVALPDEGLIAFKIKGGTENISDDLFRKIQVQSRFSNSTTTLISKFSGISAIAEDHDHQLWVGTSSGVVVYSNPDKIFEPGEFYGNQPSLDDGEGLFKPILEKEKITSIAVDGGNRKWIGTVNSGAFLFTEQGDHLLYHFDSKNSPLPTDRILAIAISPKSGEVFFATDRGLMSFKSDATTGDTSYDKAYVWPNPLKETYDKGVTIDGLTDGTDVKITDVAGNLVYQTSSIGGRAVWNAKNPNGARVSTGVYLIFCHSSQLGISRIIKLLVIH
jgi:ligand-binding sensor domain-containing protein